MALISMTGFADRSGGAGPHAWVWEVRSVNGRGLDLRLRLPDGFEALDPPVRAAAGRALARGSVTVTEPRASARAAAARTAGSSPSKPSGNLNRRSSPRPFTLRASQAQPSPSRSPARSAKPVIEVSGMRPHSPGRRNSADAFAKLASN